MSYIYTASVTELKTNLTSTKQFTELYAAKAWVDRQSRHRKTLFSIDYANRQQEEKAEPVWRYKAKVRNCKNFSVYWEFFDNLAEARQWLASNGRADSDMCSLTRIGVKEK